jgi:dTMP kinase
MKKPGKFISIEGIEGVGKSTAVKVLTQYLETNGIEYVLTREPGGTPIAEKIRDVLLANHKEPLCDDTEVLLMFAGRAQNIAQVIKPALKKGLWVISDRFTDASFAYQGGGRQIPIEHIEELASWVQGDLRPDITFLLDAPVAVGLSRMNSRGAKDRIEQEGHEFFERVRDMYLQCAKKAPERFRIIDAARSIVEVSESIIAELEL